MTNFPWLTTLMLIPAVGALVVALLPAGRARLARPLALAVSLLTLLVGIGAAMQFDRGAEEQFQLSEVHSWIPQLGVSYALGVDGIALSLILMSLVLVPICLVAAWDDLDGEDPRARTYFALMLVLEAFMVGVFAATDVFLFYVFFEAMLVPVYFLIGLFGGAGRRGAAVKFLIYSLVGGLVMLVGVIGLYVYGPGGSQAFLVERLQGLQVSQTAERLMFLAFFLAFAIKAPMWPVHTWLPEAAGESRPATATLLVGVLDKVGTFGMIRFCLGLFPEASRWATPVVIILALISIIYGALVALGQRDLMRLVSFTSISHFGFIVLGIFAMTSVSQAGSALYMVNHGFTTAALFLIAGMLIRRRGSKDIADFGGWQRVTPLIAGTFLIAGLSALSLPGLNSFVSEFMVIVGTYQRHPWAAVIAATGVILAAAYVMRLYKDTMTGERPQGLGSVPDLTGREAWVVAPLIAIFLVLGFYPKPVLDLVEPAVHTTMQQVGMADPAPTTGDAAAEGSAH